MKTTDDGRAIIEAGNWKARAIEANLANADTGTPHVSILFRLVEGPDEGQTIQWNGYLSDKALERSLESLRHCGWDSDNLSELASVTKNEVRLVVEHEVSQQGESVGKVFARVRWVNAADALRVRNPMSPGDKAAFAERMRGAVIAHRMKTGAAAAPSGNSAKPTDDDIPF
ncbi:MAG TPA: hypothetical protein VGI70_18245 [Polyangiales bacterium]|jgi:hypothetical protein